MTYVGRFAPSPTGPLHRGSLLAALASYLDARHNQGLWRLRIEDIDEPRCRPEYAARILQSLEALGLHWDGPVLWQSKQLERYQDVFQKLRDKGFIYPCACTRKQLREQVPAGADAPYPGTCRGGLAEGQSARAWRLKLADSTTTFVDRLLGAQTQIPAQQCGDMVIRRADGLFAYQFVVVIDDHDQNITDIVRGADLLSSTGRQLLLQRQLAALTPRYLHIPLILDQNGNKLSKQNGAPEVDWQRAPEDCLNTALSDLGQNRQTGDVQAILRQAACQWDISKIPLTN